jgi:hypothetical protein
MRADVRGSARLCSKRVGFATKRMTMFKPDRRGFDAALDGFRFDGSAKQMTLASDRYYMTKSNY